MKVEVSSRGTCFWVLLITQNPFCGRIFGSLGLLQDNHRWLAKSTRNPILAMKLSRPVRVNARAQLLVRRMQVQDKRQVQGSTGMRLSGKDERFRRNDEG